MRRQVDPESRWWTLGGAEVLDVMSTVRRLVQRGQTVHIGTDAQKSAHRMEFVTVACVLNPGKGGRVFYTRRFDRKEISRGQVLVNFSESSENIRKMESVVDAVKLRAGMLQRMPTPVEHADDVALLDGPAGPSDLAEVLRRLPEYDARIP